MHIYLIKIKSSLRENLLFGIKKSVVLNIFKYLFLSMFFKKNLSVYLLYQDSFKVGIKLGQSERVAWTYIHYRR